MKRAAIYVRVSRDDTGEGRSVARQLEACRKLCELRGWQVQHEEQDNSISAWSGKERPAWDRVLRLVEDGRVDVVVAWHIDRMTRSMLDLEHLILLAEGKGVGVATATGDIDLTTDVGRMVARILAAVARAEVERKAARQRLANEQRAREGRPSTGGARPFGYARDHSVIPEEAAAIRDGARWALAGVSMREIARRWEAAGLRSTRADEMASSAAFTGRGVKNTLVSPRYAGIRTYRGEQVGTGDWEPILDEETHRSLVVRLTDPTRRMGVSSKGRTPSNLLSGIARCSECDATVNGSRAHGRLTYTCRPHGHIATPRGLADAEAGAQVVAYLSLPDVMAQLAPSGDSEVDEARQEADQVREQLDELALAYASRVITLSQLTKATEALQERLTVLDGVIGRSGQSQALSGLSVGSERVLGQWNELALERKRLVVSTLASVTLFPVGVGSRVAWDPTRHMKVAFG